MYSAFGETTVNTIRRRRTRNPLHAERFAHHRPDCSRRYRRLAGEALEDRVLLSITRADIEGIGNRLNEFVDNPEVFQEQLKEEVVRNVVGPVFDFISRNNPIPKEVQDFLTTPVVPKGSPVETFLTAVDEVLPIVDVEFMKNVNIPYEYPDALTPVILDDERTGFLEGFLETEVFDRLSFLLDTGRVADMVTSTLR